MDKKKLILIISLIVGLVIFSVITVLIFLKESTKYTVTFDTNGGTIIEKQIIKAGDEVMRPKDPVKEGYVFKEWTYKNKKYDFSSKVNSDIKLKAKWSKIEEKLEEYTITFDSDGGTTIENQTIEKGKNVTEPNAPTKEGYAFEYWMLDNEEYDFENKIESDMTLKAKWKKIPKFTVTFDSNGGSNVNQQIILEGSKVNKPTNPTKKYYKFVEWQLNGKAYNFNNIVSSDIKLIAKWELQLPTTLPKPVVEVEGDPFNRIGLENTTQCEYIVKLSNYKDYLYQNINGDYNYFIDEYYIIDKDGTTQMIQENIEEPLSYMPFCGKVYEIYIKVVRKNSNNEIVASSVSDQIIIDTKKDMTPTLGLGSWWCGSEGFCDVVFKNGMYTYRLSVFESVGTEFYGGIIEIYEKENDSYKYVGDAEHEAGLYVDIAPNTKKVYVARAYIMDDTSQKIYGNYSNELVIDTSKEEQL